MMEQDVKRHLAYAGADHDIFSDSGTARLVNKACTHCLLYGTQNNRRIIDDHMVKLDEEGELRQFSLLVQYVCNP
jgi:general secretion pathway protein A